MPISYRIDAERRLVVTTAHGVLTDEDILNLKNRLAADADFQAGMRELSDVRSVTDLQVTSAGVQKMVSLDSLSHLDGYKLAIVASENVVFGMARMYQSLTQRNLLHVNVFRDYDAAVRWLGTA
jgi:hypothetical protein